MSGSGTEVSKTSCTEKPAKSATPSSPAALSNEIIDEYCLVCHDDRKKTGGLTLASFDVATADQHAELAEKIVAKLSVGLMPPARAPQPDAATRIALITALETRLDAAAAQPNPGRRMLQRLNRAEYAAAIRSLLGLEIDADAYLPADTISASFDNIADVQTPSATPNLDKYSRDLTKLADRIVDLILTRETRYDKHYGTVVLPTRPRTPRHKGKIEAGEALSLVGAE